MKELSIIIPVYNSESTIVELSERISNVFGTYNNFEIIFVNDGSIDSSYNICKKLSEKNEHIKFISFYKNYGQTSAILAGLKEASGKVCIVMDDDLQNPPEEIPKLIDELNKGYDFIFGIPKKIQQNLFRILGSKFTLKISELMFGKPKDIYPSSFLALKNDIAQQIINYDGPYPYVSGLIFRITGNGKNVTVKQDPRKIGKSQYSITRLLKLWLSGFTNFSVLPLRVASIAGTIISLLGFIFIAVLIVQKIFFDKFLEGWTSLLGAILLFSGIQLLALGLLGEYVGRIFMLLNKTPQYSVKEKYNCDKFSVKVQSL